MSILQMQDYCFVMDTQRLSQQNMTLHQRAAWTGRDRRMGTPLSGQKYIEEACLTPRATSGLKQIKKQHLEEVGMSSQVLDMHVSPRLCTFLVHFVVKKGALDDQQAGPENVVIFWDGS
jgi:hypothetical protein